MQRIAQTWWPLAASWVLMGAELPALSAVMARLAEPEINLAAYGGVVFPLALLILSPVIMLLAASTALSKDWPSYLLLRRFTMRTGALLTVLHILIAFTPLYYVVVGGMVLRAVGRLAPTPFLAAMWILILAWLAGLIVVLHRLFSRRSKKERQTNAGKTV